MPIAPYEAIQKNAFHPLVVPTEKALPHLQKMDLQHPKIFVPYSSHFLTGRCEQFESKKMQLANRLVSEYNKMFQTWNAEKSALSTEILCSQEKPYITQSDKELLDNCGKTITDSLNRFLNQKNEQLKNALKASTILRSSQPLEEAEASLKISIAQETKKFKETLAKLHNRVDMINEETKMKAHANLAKWNENSSSELRKKTLLKERAVLQSKQEAADALKRINVVASQGSPEVREKAIQELLQEEAADRAKPDQESTDEEFPSSSELTERFERAFFMRNLEERLFQAGISLEELALWSKFKGTQLTTKIIYDKAFAFASKYAIANETSERKQDQLFNAGLDEYIRCTVNNIKLAKARGEEVSLL